MTETKLLQAQPDALQSRGDSAPPLTAGDLQHTAADNRNVFQTNTDLNDPSTSWLKGFGLTEAAGGALGAGSGAYLGFEGGKLAAFGTSFIFRAGGGAGFSEEEIGSVARSLSLRGGLLGLGVGLAAAGVAYGAYEGYEYLTRDKNKHNI